MRFVSRSLKNATTRSRFPRLVPDALTRRAAVFILRILSHFARAEPKNRARRNTGILPVYSELYRRASIAAARYFRVLLFAVESYDLSRRMSHDYRRFYPTHYVPRVFPRIRQSIRIGQVRRVSSTSSRCIFTDNYSRTNPHESWDCGQYVARDGIVFIITNTTATDVSWRVIEIVRARAISLRLNVFTSGERWRARPGKIEFHRTINRLRAKYGKHFGVSPSVYVRWNVCATRFSAQ